MSNIVQSLSSTGRVEVNGKAGIFCPEVSAEGKGQCLLIIKVTPETLKRLDGERVTIVIYPATARSTSTKGTK